MKVFKQPMFVIGFLFVGLLLAASIVYHFKYDDHIPKAPLLLMKDGKLLGQTPYSPALVPPAGTDQSGRNYGAMLLIGAKYTLGIGILTALLRVLFGAVLGTIYGLFFYRFKAIVTGLLDGFHYIPLTLLAYLLLSPVLIMDYTTETFAYSFMARLSFEVILLAVIALPVVCVNIGNEIGEHMHREYIVSAKVLGAGRLHILFKHIMPHLMPKIIYILLQQTVQVLIVLAHLGILQLFLGGTLKIGYPPDTLSQTGEWAGLIGQNYKVVASGLHTWLIFAPLILLSLSVLAFSFMAEGFKKTMMSMGRKRPAGSKRMVEERPRTFTEDDLFTPVNRRHVMVE